MRNPIGGRCFEILYKKGDFGKEDQSVSEDKQSIMPLTKSWIIEHAELLAQLFNCAEAIKNAHGDSENNNDGQLAELSHTITQEDLKQFSGMDLTDFDLSLFNLGEEDEEVYSEPKDIPRSGLSATEIASNSSEYSIPRPIKVPGYTGERVIWPCPKKNCPPTPRDSSGTNQVSTYPKCRRSLYAPPPSPAQQPPSPATARNEIRHSIARILSRSSSSGGRSPGIVSLASSSNDSSIPNIPSNGPSREGSTTPGVVTPSPCALRPTANPHGRREEDGFETQTIRNEAVATTNGAQVCIEQPTRNDTPIPPQILLRHPPREDASRMYQPMNIPVQAQNATHGNIATEYWTTPGIRMGTSTEPPTGYLSPYAVAPSLPPYQAPYYCSDLRQLPPVREIPALRLPTPQPAYTTQHYGPPTYECCIWDCWRFNPR